MKAAGWFRAGWPHGPTGFTGTGALSGTTASLSQATAAGFTSISDILPAAQYPQFRSALAGTYDGVRGPFEPFAGNGFAATRHADNSYARLTRTADLTGVRADQTPELRFALSYDTEPGYDNLIIEAHTVGQDDWTTLPQNGSDTGVPEGCVEAVGQYPALANYLTVSCGTCQPRGTTGTWNRVHGSSNGWRQTTVDLSAYAGKQVEVSITCISDPAFGGRGAFVDNASLVVGGNAVDSMDFESGLGGWRSAQWVQSGAVLRTQAAISTAHSVVIGFGLESVPAAQRAAIPRRAMATSY
ncbi:hypothetical protein [Kibdelosporangium philippinense]